MRSRFVLTVVLLLSAASLPALAQNDQRQWGRPHPPETGACFYKESYFRGDYFCMKEGEQWSTLPEADLHAFLTTDPKGKLVPGFIIKLADNIDKELSLLQAEHEQLASNVEHIKEIVAVQQTYARVSGAGRNCPSPALWMTRCR